MNELYGVTNFHPAYLTSSQDEYLHFQRQQGLYDPRSQFIRHHLPHRASWRSGGQHSAEADPGPGDPRLQWRIRHCLQSPQGGKVQGLGQDIQLGCQDQPFCGHLCLRCQE